MTRIQQWVKRLQMANESGCSRREWCKENGISENSFYYWQKKLRRLALDQTVNAPMDRLSQNQDSDQKHDFFEITVSEPDLSDPFHTVEGRSASVSGQPCLMESGLSIRAGAWTIDIAENFSRQSLRDVLEVMRDVQRST